MAGYLVLLAPSSNRVYAGSAPAITAAEVEIVVAAAVEGGIAGAEPTTLAGVPYLAVELADDASPTVLGALAATYAVFRLEGELLRPVEAPAGLHPDDDLLPIPKYPGKTTEQLTRTASSDGPAYPESSLISRTQPLSVWTLASISKAGGASCCRVSPASSDALFLPNMKSPLV